MIAGHTLIALPFLISLFGAVVSFFGLGQRWVARCVLLLHTATCLALTVTVFRDGPVATSAGGWLAPFGIVLIADAFSALMLTLSSLLFLCCLMQVERRQSPFYWPLLLLLQGGVSLSFTTGDLFNLFVAFELMLMSSYAIMTTQGRGPHLNNAYSYLVMNITASFVYLIAVALFYSYTGHLNLAALAQHLEANTDILRWTPIFALLLVVGIKSGLFPLYFWLPDSYPILPSRLAALFSGILSKVGLYVLFRLVVTILPGSDTLNTGLMIVGCLTMFFGVMGAVSKNSIPGILAYHTLSQVGYITLALSFSTPLAIGAGVLFLLHNMVVKSSLFLIGGIASQSCGSAQLDRMGGLWISSPFLGVLFLLQALSLAGLPPFSGFWGKYLLFFEGMTIEAYLATAVALVTSFFTLYSMIKIWNGAYLGEPGNDFQPIPPGRYAGAVLLTLLALFMGIFPQTAYDLSRQATDHLMDRELYISTALRTGYKG